MRSLPRGLQGVLAVVVLVVLVVLALQLGTGTQPTAAPTTGSTTGTPAAPRSGSPRGPSTVASADRDPQTGLRWVDLGTLPRQAQQTVALIQRGGPYPYAKDGVVFGNRERILPTQRGGYYREYTVPTPGEGDRGARRVVTGDSDRQFFYTGDHYASFVRIRP